MSQLWIATLVSSLICFLFKYLGYRIPESFLNKPAIQRINSLIPIALLSSLVAVQALTTEQQVVIDHRLVGLLVAAIALTFKANFPVMMLLAAASSATVYNL